MVALFGELYWAGRDRLEADDVVGPGGTFEGHLGVPNTGRLEAAVRPSLTLGLLDQMTLALQLRIPFYTRIREDSARRDVQLREPVGFQLGLSFSF